MLRPHLYQFLSVVSSVFKVVAFTASIRYYANQLLDIIDPNREYFVGRFFRESCVNNFYKDLQFVQSDMATICIVDNIARSYDLQPENGIPITSWFGCKDDNELMELLPFLASLTYVPDVRPLIAKYIKLSANGLLKFHDGAVVQTHILTSARTSADGDCDMNSVDDSAHLS